MAPKLAYRRGMGRLNPRREAKYKEQTGRFFREKLIFDHERSAERAKFVGLFQGYVGGRLDAGSRAGFTSSRPPSLWTSEFQFSLFFCMCGLEKLGLVERDLSALLLRTLAVGRRQQSE